MGARLRAIDKASRRWLILGHRWVGIATGLFFAVWIGSGLVMLYVPFPVLTEPERLARLAPIAWERIAIGPDAALAAAGLSGVPAAFALEMRDGAPAYRIADRDGARATVSAESGALLGPVDPAAALRIAGGGPAAQVEPVARDQWTVTARYDPLRPFLKVALGDDAGTELYVSRATGEIALDTTRHARAWNWLGSVPHWIYLTPLRARAELWRTLLLWLSGVAALGALAGALLGIWRLRLRRRYAAGRVSPYRGLARWHHLAGLVGGLGLAGFIVSGWLSMNPNRWFSSSAPPAALLAAYAGAPGPLGIDAAVLAGRAVPGTRRLRFVPLGGRWWIAAEAPGDARIARLDGAALDPGAIAAAAAGAVPGGHLRGARLLTQFDAYWYPHGTDPRVLPILRLRFDDPDATWLHVDPRMGTVLARLDRSGRLSRWLFDAPHRLDLPGLTAHPAARRGAQWLLNALGAVIAVTGIVAGWRRLRRSLS